MTVIQTTCFRGMPVGSNNPIHATSQRAAAGPATGGSPVDAHRLVCMCVCVCECECSVSRWLIVVMMCAQPIRRSLEEMPRGKRGSVERSGGVQPTDMLRQCATTQHVTTNDSATVDVDGRIRSIVRKLLLLYVYRRPEQRQDVTSTYRVTAMADCHMREVPARTCETLQNHALDENNRQSTGTNARAGTTDSLVVAYSRERIRDGIFCRSLSASQRMARTDSRRPEVLRVMLIAR